MSILLFPNPHHQVLLVYFDHIWMFKPCSNSFILMLWQPISGYGMNDWVEFWCTRLVLEPMEKLLILLFKVKHEVSSHHKNLQTQDCEEGKATQEDISTVMVVYTRNNPRPIIHGIASRVRRMLCLLTLLAGIVIPTILRIFFIADNRSRLTHNNNWDESLLEADAFFANDDADDSVENAEAADSKLISSSKIMTMKEYRRNAPHDYFTRINTGHDYESNRMLMSEAIEYQIVDQKRSIHVIVTTVIAFLLPFLALLYAFIFQKETQGSIIRSLNKRRRRRKERQILHQGLQECRIQLPTTITTPEDTTSATTDDDKQRRECPICLLGFTAGDMVIASKHCQCSIPRTNKAIRGTTDIIASIAKNNSSIQSQFYHRIFFHEQCIFTWLSQRKTNPKKLCPCCRQPFLESKATV
ncbi:hypothetical protein FRACYDRAFT_250329 [Fragilariopsis cylindrus CCMP1102]|uniref:Uncharacterized protein n=1 Tax=Fragilariopsis cylindrus CCMP1102 TaxID=635003 RepID=A0A1E7EQM1_9STRA|nr:hypothetical protein FRACYDRAFT_250329 [Fragilariopsis cylindrus CCMP1102]|eukprot:OEU08106.1 hypothetical protein FRACYDRAFT_250329 [Fragilariopsis cylindrus CCMP1102]